MRRGLIALLVALLLPLRCLAQQDTLNLYGSLKEYFDAVCTLPVDSINARCDALIASVSDDKSRAAIAGTAFNYFLECPVMGAEGVSVHIADNYFLNKRLKWPSEATYPTLYAFAEFNRQSLLGMPAAPLQLENIDGDTVDVREATGGPKVLYFYEDGCATCSVQTPLIVSCLKGYDADAPLTLYAVYTQSDRTAWARYALTAFRGIDNPKIRVVHLWDPEGKSQFHKKYSVLTTPSLLLLDEDNRICGRKLDAAALGALLGQKKSFEESLYSLMDGVRDNMGLDTASVADVCRAFHSRLESDAPLYRETFSGIYNYLRGQGNYEAMQSAALVAREYIAGQPQYWSQEMLESAREALRIFSLNPLGSKAADVMLLDRGGHRRHLIGHCGKKYAVIFFNLVSCEECRAWKEELLQMRKTLRRSGVRITSVYVGPDSQEWRDSLRSRGRWWRDLRAEWPQSELYSKYDVSVAPKIYLLDATGTVIAKDITPETLAKLLQE